MVLRGPILAAARSERVRRLAAQAPVSRAVVRRFVAGESVPDALRVARELADRGLLVSLDHLGEDSAAVAEARQAAQVYVTLLHGLDRARLGGVAEVSIKLTALGLDLEPDLALDGAARVCAAAREVGTTVTVDMEDSGRTEATLTAVRQLRRRYPSTGVVLQAYLRRTEADCRQFAGPGSRVRLCKGAYREPAERAYVTRGDVLASYARCLGVLFAGTGYPMVASHDPVVLGLAARLAARLARPADSYEFQMLYGVRPEAQLALAGSGRRMRVYVPFGRDWYGYLMRRLAERPANLGFFLRALASRA